MRPLLGVMLVILMIGCEDNSLYERNYEFEQKVWYLDSMPSFQFEIEDTEEPVDIYLNLRNTLAYPFQNIYLTYFLEDTTGEELQRELVNYQLFDAKTGEPYGDGGIGDILDHRFKLLEDYQFNESGAYRIRVAQYMRRDSLPEIVAVGIRVERNNIGN